MGNHQAWIKIDECINSYIDRSEQGIHKYFKLFHICFDGMNQMGLDSFYAVKSVKLPINANLTVNLPPDYLNYTKVGILNGRGEVVPLDYNNKLTTYADLLPDRLDKTQDGSLWQWYTYNNLIFYNYWDGFNFINLYGIPSGAPFVGSFKIDNKNNVILLDENFCWDYIILEYMASPQEGGEYYIPIQFKEAMIWFLAWQDIALLPNTRKGGLGDKEQRRKNYFNERRRAIAQYKPLHLEEAYEWNLKNQRLVVKG
jgi:hypothetical protein